MTPMKAVASAEWTSQDYATLFTGLSAGGILLTLAATVVFGVLNLQRAARGPNKVPSWSLDRPHAAKDTVVLNNHRDAGSAYDVDIEPPNTPMWRGERHHDRIDPGQGVTLVIKFTGASGPSERTLTLTYRETAKGPKKTWTTTVPS